MATWTVQSTLPGVTATRQPSTSSYTIPGATLPGVKAASNPFAGAFVPGSTGSVAIQPTQQVQSAPLQPTQKAGTGKTPGSYLPGSGEFGQGPVQTQGGSQATQQQVPTQPGGGQKPTTWVTPASSSSQRPVPPPPQENPVFRTPGTYENWYASHASQYDQPTNIQGYADRNLGKFENYQYDPFNTQGAYGDIRSKLGGTSYGTGVSRQVADELGRPLQGSQYYSQAGGMLDDPNLATNYANKTAGFFAEPTDSKLLNWNLGNELQADGFGQRMLQAELPGLNTVGSEFDYFQDPLRSKSYSEQLYESGNQGLNTFYDRENEKRQEALERRMAATGVFGSGETVKGMAEIEAELGAQQARDMAALAGQADESFRGRAGLAQNFATASSNEDLARLGLGLDLDKFGLDKSRLRMDLAGQSDQTSLDRILGGSTVAKAGDESRLSQADKLRMLGDSQTGSELDRLKARSETALAGDQEERLRANDVFDAAKSLDDLRLRGDQTELDYLSRGSDLANTADTQNLDWLNSGGDAADRAQERFEQRERYGVNDALKYAEALSGLYTGATNSANDEQTAMQSEAIGLLMQKQGLSYQEAMQKANEWMQLGTMATQLAMLKGG